MTKERISIDQCIIKEDGTSLPVRDCQSSNQEGFVTTLVSYWSYSFYSVAITGLLALFLYCTMTNLPFSVLTRDPLALTNGKPYFGFISNIGILFWCGTSSICLFAWLIVRTTGRPNKKKFLFFSGCLTMMLLLDDLFMLHEYVFPEMMGIRQRYVMLTYILITFAYLMCVWKHIPRQHASKLISAFFFFVVSVAADTVLDGGDHWQHLLEDGTKFLGIISWFNFFLHVCKEEITSLFVLRID